MSEQNKIDEIKAALSNSTQGEWFAHEESAIFFETESVLGVIAGNVRPGDAHLIAKAPEYITYLLAENERIQQEISAYQAWQPNAWDNAQELQRLREQIERKDKALRTMAESQDEWYVGLTPMREYARQALAAL